MDVRVNVLNRMMFFVIRKLYVGKNLCDLAFAKSKKAHLKE
jgi:hypothetical protein